MTSPFPTQFNNQVIQDPGTGGAIAGALAQVLAARQQQMENEFRMIYPLTWDSFNKNGRIAP